jgi:hypothetical protein
MALPQQRCSCVDRRVDGLHRHGRAQDIIEPCESLAPNLGLGCRPDPAAAGEYEPWRECRNGEFP